LGELWTDEEEAHTEVGYADASMAEIARRAGVAKSVVSYHFSDKDGLMREVLRTALATYAKFMEPRTAARRGVPGFRRGVAAGVMRSPITHTMVMRQREDPGTDLGAYAEEMVRLFDLGIRR
jgi:AcrR family transcriptional regulator